VDKVSASVDAEVTTDRARCRVEWVCLSKENASLLDCIFTFPDHWYDWARGHVLDEAIKEGACREISIMLLEELYRSLLELDGNELVATLFEALDNCSDETALYAVWLNHDECAF
jgi:hypothetical protein